MSHCTLLFPGLLGPAVPLDELPRDSWPTKSELPCLSQLLRRGKIKPRERQAFEYQLLTRFGYAIPPDTELPVAQLRARASVELEADQLWCLDPVHVQLDREMAYLAPPDAMSLSEDEAKVLIANLNTHFADELHIHYYTPQQWLVNLALDVSTASPTQALGQSIQQVQASGKHARRWRSLLNEIQMLLHADPVNLAREAAGELPVNSLWLWGGGELSEPSASIDVVYANDELSITAADHTGVRYHELPTVITDSLADHDSLLILTLELDALRRKDVYAWLDGLRVLEKNYLAPLHDMLRRGKLDRLILTSDSLELELDKPRLGRWWQRPKPLATVITGLRERCGY